jgi:hypothetical protein
MKCPKCESLSINQYRHPKSKIWCTSCEFVLRDEGETDFNIFASVNGKQLQEPEVKICINCIHCIHCIKSGLNYHECKRTETINIVTGEKEYNSCTFERDNGYGCDIDAEFFKPKEVSK